MHLCSLSFSFPFFLRAVRIKLFFTVGLETVWSRKRYNSNNRWVLLREIVNRNSYEDNRSIVFFSLLFKHVLFFFLLDASKVAMVASHWLAISLATWWISTPSVMYSISERELAWLTYAYHFTNLKKDNNFTVYAYILITFNCSNASLFSERVKSLLWTF